MRYYRLTLNGKSCLFDDPYHLVDELFNMVVNEDENSPLTVQAVEMTEEEYEKVKEFDGW